MKLENQYSEIFEATYLKRSDSIDHHIYRLKELDRLLPPSSTFLILTDTTTQKYEYLSSNFEYNTQHDKNLFLQYGIPYFLQHIHPEDISVWLGVLQDMMTYCMTEIHHEDRIKLSFTYNYRFKKADGTYINLLENQIPIQLDSDGKPVVGVGHFSVIGEGEALPIKGSIKILNASDQYETLVYKNYTQSLLTDGLSNRERDIIRLIAMSKTSREIADELCLSPFTIDTHRKNILKKLNLNSKADIIAFYQSNNFF